MKSSRLCRYLCPTTLEYGACSGLVKCVKILVVGPLRRRSNDVKRVASEKSSMFDLKFNPKYFRFFVSYVDLGICTMRRGEYLFAAIIGVCRDSATLRATTTSDAPFPFCRSRSSLRTIHMETAPGISPTRCSWVRWQSLASQPVNLMLIYGRDRAAAQNSLNVASSATNGTRSGADSSIALTTQDTPLQE